MNRTGIAIFFVIIAVAIGISSLLYVETTYDKMNTLMEAVSKSASEDNKEETLNLLKEADARWDKHKKALNIFLGQGETGKVKANIQMAKLFAVHDDMESVILYTHECQTELYRIREMNRPSWNTIL